MAVKITIAVLFFAYISFIFTVAHMYDAREMKRRFIDGQNVAGRIFTNAFYAPAWLLKGIRFLVVAIVK